jgi:hypothetical protein
MGLRTAKTLAIPGESETVDVKYPSQTRLRALLVKASAAPRLAGESKDEAQGWALMREVVQDSVVAWSYCDEAGEPVPVSEETIDDLDAKTTKWLFRELIGNDVEGKASD